MEEIMQHIKRIIPYPTVFENPQTHHYRNGYEVTDKISYFEIYETDDKSGYYLFYHSASGEELNDLYFDSIAELSNQLLKEFGIEYGS